MDWRVGAGLVAIGLLLITAGAKIIEGWLKSAERKARLIEAMNY